MYQGKSILCLILARGGSKGIKDKNMIKVLGKPLIEYSFEQIKKSKFIDHTIISTDSDKLIKISKKNKIDAPFVRPKYISRDNSKSEDAILHALRFLEKRGQQFDYVILIEPTSPLRTHLDIDGIIKFNIDKKFTTSVSLSDVSTCHPNFMFNIKSNKIYKKFKSEEFKHLPRQKISKLYFMEGSLYIADTKYFKNKKSFTCSNTGGYLMQKWKSLEIDEPIDVVIFESLLKNIKSFRKFN